MKHRDHLIIQIPKTASGSLTRHYGLPFAAVLLFGVVALGLERFRRV